MYTDLARSQGTAPGSTPVSPTPRAGGTKQPSEPKNVRPDVRTDERTDVRTDRPKPDRVVVRHPFDIFEDQLHALYAIQLNAVRSGRKKPKLGAMVRKAIDHYLQGKAQSIKK
jgi:hypothetical protein